MRIQRALGRAGVASRRHAEELIAEGRVLVNGEPAKIGQSVDPARDTITVDGRKVAAPATAAEARWIVLHKPAGVMTTRRDPEGRRTVFDIVEDVPGLTYVGRLDLLTEGVLLLTTDGEAAHKLTHPSREVERTYVAHVRGDADEAAADALEHGVELEDGLVRPRRATARHLGRGRWLFEVTLVEGRNREVRRLCEALGLQVDKLVRTRFGPIQLGELEPGRSRSLTPRERTALEKLLGRGR
jgi:23S rRNA pseudouridine2605 synthase